MTLQTSEVDKQAPTINDKKAKIAALYEMHKSILTQLGVVERNFIPKLPYPVDGETVLGFFPSEINRGTDIYIEFATPDYDPYDDDDERKLWRLPNNSQYDKDYNRTSTDPNKFRYLVPITELEEVTTANANAKVKIEKPKEVVQVELSLSNDKEDAPFTDFTIRDHIAIEKGIPVSNKPWLNELVTKQLKHD